MSPLLADFIHARACKPFCEKSLTLPVYDDLKQTIQKHNLKQLPDNSMSRFIREHFPEVWEKE